LAQRRSELDLARQQLIGTTVYAPFDGIVEQKIASIGEFLAAGAPVATIVKVNPLRFRAEVPERDASSVRAGQQVRVTVEGDMNAHNGRVVRLSPSITEQNRVLIVEAEIVNSGLLRPGSFARAEIVTSDSTMAVTVPASAGIEKVITVEGGKAKEKPITTGRRLGEWTEVLAGVNVGESVIADPGNLQSGQAVNVVE
jgi:RND family efflux transporter MFP subunit